MNDKFFIIERKYIMSQKNKGIILIIMSAFFFALMNMMVRLAGDLPSIEKSFFRNFVAVFFADAFCLWNTWYFM